MAKCWPRSSGTGTSSRWTCCVAEVEPGPTEAEVGAVGANGEPEHVGVEGDGLVGVVDVDRHVVDPEWLHGPSLAPQPRATGAGT